MSQTPIKRLPSPEEIIRAIPLSARGYERIARDREEIKAILDGRDPRLLVIAGPCSAWPSAAVVTYAARLRELQSRVAGAIKLVMRVYTQKPRTLTGWAGASNQPDPFSPPDIEAGLRYAREMMVEVVELGVPVADEVLYTHHVRASLDLVAWAAIGARSSEDQEHRTFASGLSCAVGLKNPTHGALRVAVNSVLVAQRSHVFALDGYEVKTDGNPYAHLVLRGGDGRPNCHPESIEEVRRLMSAGGIQNPALLIDASHDNTILGGQRDHRRQPQVIRGAAANLSQRPEHRRLVRGFMLESFLKDGAQELDPARPEAVDLGGLSITDPCLGWEETEALIRELGG